MDDLTGRAIRGYELRQRIGTGGFGAVYRAYQPIVKREVAIKIILPERASRPDFIRRFEQEAEVVARLEHLHIVPLYDYWRDPDGAYLVMRWLRGGSLETILRQQGAWSIARTQKLLNQIAAALAVAHRHGVIHRDIKPANILLDDDGNAYLTDFGIAKDISRTWAVEPDEGFFGSPAYVSPEQVLREPLGPPTDIYSLGIVLYELLTGSRPFAGDTDTTLMRLQVSRSLPSIRESQPDLPAFLDIVLRRATAKYPDARHASVLELAADFQRVANLSATTPGPGNPLPTAATSVVSNETIDLDPGTIELNTNGGDTPGTLDLDRSGTLEILDADVTTTRGLEAEPYATLEIGTLPLPVLEPRNPFKGLRPFDEADATDFFGRDDLTRQLLKRLGESRFLAVVGPSGSGKSSVVRAGVIPALRQGALATDWYIAQLTPGAQPFVALQAALAGIAVQLPVDLSTQLAADPDRLNQLFADILPDDDSQLLLFIDQFEEAFTQTTDIVVRAAFLDCLVAVAQGDRARVVVTLRADFYDQPLLYPAFAQLMRQHTEIVLPLTDQELKRAITAPAERVDLIVEPALVAAIVRDVQAQPGALPLLQYALTELFERREQMTLTMAAYAAIDGVSGALARRADDIYAALAEPEQAAARQLFLRLVTPGAGTEDTRRRVWQSELEALNDGAMSRLIAILGQYRLLTFDRDSSTRAPTVELAHEALIRRWDRLRQWLDSSREALQLQRRLAQATGEWLRTNRDASYLATGARLAQFETLAAGDVVALNAEETSYLTASLTLRTAAERRRRLTLVGLAVFSLVALALALFAFDRQGRAEVERVRADQQAAVATSRELAVTALTTIDEQLDRSLLLSLEALRTADTLAARNSLLTALAAEPHLVRYLHGGGLPVRAVALDPTGQIAAAGGTGSDIQLWNPMTGQPLGDPLTGHDDWVNDLAFSPDRERLASASNDQTVRVWSLKTGDILREFTDHAATVRAVAFNPNGNLLASGSDDQMVRIYEVETGDLFHELMGHTDVIFDLAFDPTGERLASASGDGTLRLWDVETGTLLGEPLTGHDDFVLSLAFNPDGGLLVSGGADNTIRLWDVVSGTELNQFRGHTNWVRSVAISADGQTLVSASADQTVRVWHLLTGQPIVTPFTGHVDVVWSLALNADTILSGGADARVLIWNLTPQNADVVGQQAEAVTSLALHPDANTLASANGNPTGTGADNAIVLWGLNAAAEPVRLEGHQRSVTSLAFHPDGAQLASSSVDQSVRLWDLTTGTVQTLSGHTDAVMSVAFRPDGAQIASGGFDNVVRLWDSQTGVAAGESLVGHTDAVVSLAYSPDGALLASGSFDGTVRLWDAETGEPIGEPLTGHADNVTFVTFSADGQYLATTSRDGTTRVWNLTTRDALVLVGHDNYVISAAFHPTEPILVTGSWDETLRLWDLETGLPLGEPLIGHSGWVSALAFDATGSELYSGSQDKTILRWPLSRADWTQRACQIANRDFSPAEVQQYLRVEIAEDICAT